MYWLQRIVEYFSHKEVPQVRRLAVFEMTAELLVALFQKQDPLVSWTCEGIPDDAKVVGIDAEPMRGVFRVLLESEAFSPVGMGCLPYSINPSYTVIHWSDDVRAKMVQDLLERGYALPERK